MRLPGSDHRCGPLLELGHVQRRLHLGAPIVEGTATIAVACIIGTASRAQDFDACFHPLRPALEGPIADIERSGDGTLDKAIDVVRVDRAYFVADGHKRVAIARRSGREFIDAHVSHMPTPYEVTGDIEGDAIERTAREGEFRRHSGLAEGVPGMRFALTDIGDYGELFESVRLHSLEASIEAGRLLPAPEAAAGWYESVYLPGIALTRETVGDLLGSCTDADVFLAFHRQARGYWGTECDAAECAADQVLASTRRAAARDRSPIGLVMGLAGRRQAPAPMLLPLAEPDEPG